MNSGSPFFTKRQSALPLSTRGSCLVLGICGLVACHHPTPAPMPLREQRVDRSRGPVETKAAEPSIQADNTNLTPVSAAPATAENPINRLAEAAWSELPLPSFEPALLWYRAGAKLFVITHGAGGEAKWHCQHYHRLLNGQASLLCPQGKRRHAGDSTQGYYYPDHFALRREVLQAIAQFEATVASVNPTRPYIYAGYSQGATMGALAFAQHGQLFSQLLLVEGGYADWSQALVTQFQQSGGKAVLFVCGTKPCATKAEGAVHRFTASGLDAKLAWAKGAGHVPNGAVGQALSNSLGFLLADDPRWQGFTPNADDYSAPRSE